MRTRIILSVLASVGVGVGITGAGVRLSSFGTSYMAYGRLVAVDAAVVVGGADVMVPTWSRGAYIPRGRDQSTVKIIMGGRVSPAAARSAAAAAVVFPARSVRKMLLTLS